MGWRKTCNAMPRDARDDRCVSYSNTKETRMSDTDELPDLGAQVRPLIQALPRAIQPRLIAELERAAAERYQAWAASCPEPAQAEGLRDCAAREQEVARRVEALFPSHTDERRYFSDALPRLAEAYRSAFVHRSVTDQYAIQAAAERRGAEFWRSLATSLSDPAARKVLSSCADLEERSAQFLEALLTPKP
jgi:rubrerythrin